MYWLNSYRLTMYGLTHVRADHAPGGTAAAVQMQRFGTTDVTPAI